MTLFQVSYLLLWLLALFLIPISIVLAYLLVQLEGQFNREGAGHGNNLIGRKMPEFPATNAVTGKLENSFGYPGKVHVVLALSADCTSCRNLMRELSTSVNDDFASIRLAVLCMGYMESCKEAVSEIAGVPVFLYDLHTETTSDLWLAGFPAALIVDESGIVVDVRHPLSLKGVATAVKDATLSYDYRRGAARASVATLGTNAS